MAQAERASRWIPYAFVAAFLVVVAANGTLIAFAIGTWSGLETDRAFERGVAYNDTLARVRAEAALGWNATVTGSGRPEAARIELALRGPDGTPLGVPGSVTALLRRPAASGIDQQVTLAAVGPGLYRAEVALPAPGVWDAQLAFEHAHGRFHAAERLVFRP